MEMSSWVDSFVQELVSTSEATEEEAWEVIGACLKKMFEVIRVPRAQAANATMDNDPKSQCTTYLWALIQSHRIMKEFADARFQNHGAIAPVIVLHIFKTHVTQTAMISNIKRLESRLATLEKGGKDKEPKHKQDAVEGKVISSAPISGKRSLPVSKGRTVVVEEAIQTCDYARYGVTIGRMKLMSTQVTCGVVSTGWPSFALAAKARGWLVSCIVVLNNDWGSLIRRIFSDSMVLNGTESAVDKLGCKFSPMVWLCDVESPRRLKVWGIDGGVQPTVLCLRRLRQEAPVGYSY
jgi:hypothetical protein